MKKTLLILLAGITFSATSQIAVTEFMNNPATDDIYHEWIELYNYSANSVNLKKWSVSDEGIDLAQITATDLIMQPNTYLILTSDKDSMEANWFGGVANVNVIGYDRNDLNLANGADEIVLKDSTGAVVWSLAYANDDVTGVATFLEYSHDFSSALTVWGSEASPAIDRDSIDVVVVTKGYEGDTTVDVDAVPSALGDVQGSPLAGSYTPVNSTSITSIESANKLTVYPNPSTTGMVNFSEVVSGVMLDVTGKEVLAFNKRKNVSVASLKEGIYFINTNLGTYKFIKK